jgi:16S rRNA processing protein RimM
MPMQNKTEWATIGKIVALFGLRGELKVASFSDIPDRFVHLDSVHLGPDHTRYVIEGVRPYKGDMVLLKLSGIDDANAAEPLRNLALCIPLDQLAELPPDSYYQHDILGLQVYTLENRSVGVIVDIIITGSNDVYVVKGQDRQQILIPAIKAVIKQVDLIRRKMYIDPIKGMIDDDAEVDASSPKSDADEEEVQ